MPNNQSNLTCIEICSGAGGQALGLEDAGFHALSHVENDKHACNTLRLNRPNWNVVEQGVREFSAKQYDGVDLFAGGVQIRRAPNSDQVEILKWLISKFPKQSKKFAK